MTNAALYMHENAYDTGTSRLLGRHSAGESFLRGFLRHADVEQYWFYNATTAQQARMEQFVARIEELRKPSTWIGCSNRAALENIGVLNMPVPDIAREAWQRQAVGARRYGICGITHTTATQNVMDILTDMAASPLEDHDALVCTSTAVRASVEAQLTMMRDHMTELYGPRKRPEVQRVTIPLGVNASDFEITPAARKEWRERLGIPEDGVVALYVGRFNVRGKMNPALMAMALERAARRTDKPLYWLNSGWAETEKDAAHFHEQSRALCPSVHYLEVDGRKPEVRFSIWSAGDLFISFSDNIQETFGLTPIEAMAAGLPAVVSDWNGYKDTVRHGVDGFRIPTLAPRAGLGGDLAYWFANGWMSYDNYVGATAQFTAVDLAEAEAAILALVQDPDLRRRMGVAGQARAREVFDWAVIIPQYQSLWAELDARRRAAPAQQPKASPLRPDPFALFANYPTRWLSKEDFVSLVPGAGATPKEQLSRPLAVYSQFNRPTDAEVEAIVARLAAQPMTPVKDVLELFPAARRPFIERGLLWLARHDIIAVQHAPGSG